MVPSRMTCGHCVPEFGPSGTVDAGLWEALLPSLLLLCSCGLCLSRHEEVVAGFIYYANIYIVLARCRVLSEVLYEY